MKEDYCSFETSKLLKEKGFDEMCDHYIDCHWEEDGVLLHTPCKTSDLMFGYMCPTHQMAMKWLREKGYHIVIMRDVPKYQVYIQDLNDGGFNVSGITRTFNTYEEAVEDAIKYSLENLI